MTSILNEWRRKIRRRLSGRKKGAEHKSSGKPQYLHYWLRLVLATPAASPLSGLFADALGGERHEPYLGVYNRSQDARCRQSAHSDYASTTSASLMLSNGGVAPSTDCASIAGPPSTIYGQICGVRGGSEPLHHGCVQTSASGRAGADLSCAPS